MLDICHIDGAKNLVADILSRSDIPLIFSITTVNLPLFYVARSKSSSKLQTVQEIDIWCETTASVNRVYLTRNFQ